MKIIHGGNVWQEGSPADWLDFSANIRPGGAPDWVKEALAEGMENARYYPALDMHRARKALSEYLQLKESFVMPCAGGVSAITMATRCGAKEVFVCAPCFGEYGSAAHQAGLPWTSISLMRKDRAIEDPRIALKDVLDNGSLVWLCSPMNPVGYAFEREQIEDLLELIREKQCRLAVDEAFIDFCPDSSVRDLVNGHPELIITGSFTKSLGIPGVRLGYLCAQDADILAQAMLPWELNCFAESVLLALPGHREAIETDAEINRSRREDFKSQLEGLGLYVYPSQADFLLVDFRKKTDVIVKKLKDRHILVRTCLDFKGVNDGRHLRLAVKDEASNETLIEALKEIL